MRTGTIEWVAGGTRTTLALFLTFVTPPTPRTLLCAVNAQVTWMTLAHPILGIAASSRLIIALALMTTVGAPGHIRAGFVATGTKSTWVAFTETKVFVAMHRWALNGTWSLASTSIVSCWTPVFTVCAGHAWRAGARSHKSITRPSILAHTYLIASLSIESLWTWFLTERTRSTRRTHTPILITIPRTLLTQDFTIAPCITMWTSGMY